MSAFVILLNEETDDDEAGGLEEANFSMGALGAIAARVLREDVCGALDISVMAQEAAGLRCTGDGDTVSAA